MIIFLLKTSVSLIIYNFIFPKNQHLGQPCRCCTRYVRCHAGITTSLEAWLSPGWATTRAASPQTRAASTSGTPWRTWRPHGQTRRPCLLPSQWTQTSLNQTPYVKTKTKHYYTCCWNSLTSQCWGLYVILIFGRPSERERTECLIKAKLRSIMTCQDLENVTCKQVK